MAILNIKDENGDFIAIPSTVGPQGDKGDSYILTESDKQEIANLVYAMMTN